MACGLCATWATKRAPPPRLQALVGYNFSSTGLLDSSTRSRQSRQEHMFCTICTVGFGAPSDGLDLHVRPKMHLVPSHISSVLELVRGPWFRLRFRNAVNLVISPVTIRTILFRERHRPDKVLHIHLRPTHCSFPVHCSCCMWHACKTRLDYPPSMSGGRG